MFYSNSPVQLGHLPVFNEEFLFFTPFSSKDEKSDTQYNNPEQEKKENNKKNNQQPNNNFRHSSSFWGSLGKMNEADNG